jgi:hypothetical protein
MPDVQGRKIVDCHTHLIWYPDHVSQEYAEEAPSRDADVQ